jgi:hypothetical protein
MFEASSFLECGKDIEQPKQFSDLFYNRVFVVVHQTQPFVTLLAKLKQKAFVFYVAFLDAKLITGWSFRHHDDSASYAPFAKPGGR